MGLIDIFVRLITRNEVKNIKKSLDENSEYQTALKDFNKSYDEFSKKVNQKLKKHGIEISNDE